MASLLDQVAEHHEMMRSIPRSIQRFIWTAKCGTVFSAGLRDKKRSNHGHAIRSS